MLHKNEKMIPLNEEAFLVSQLALHLMP